MPRHNHPGPIPFADVCDLCGAYVANKPAHVYWHSQLAGLAPAAGDDDTPTAKLPPIRDRILPRPPALEVRELTGAELLRAIAAELEADEDLADEDDGR